jgi:hypothetical protein
MSTSLDSDFHDGTIRGLWIEQDVLHILLATAEGNEYALVVHGTVAVFSSGFSTQNIIFDVKIKESNELREDDVREVYGLSESSGDEARVIRLMEDSRKKGLVLLVVDPSCGANCLALGRSVELITRDAWTSHFLLRVPSSS